MNHKRYTREYIHKFCDRLSAIDPSKISGEEYQQKYFQYILSHKKYFVEIYAFVLDNVIDRSSKQPEDITFLDCGAGNGLLGIFAKFCGFKQVYINESDSHFLESAKKLSSELAIDIDGFILGDILHLKNDIKSLNINAISGTDVIEHIYSLEKLFALLQEVNPDMTSVFSTASNPYNYLRKKEIIRIQLKDELEGGNPEDDFFSGPKRLGPFLKIREEIIKEKYPLTPDAEIRKLAKLTRGSIKEDVLIAAGNYFSKNILPVPLRHPTNTCNPLDGSWSERIFPPEEYIAIYKNHNFSLLIKNGFYNEHQNGIKGLSLYILNRIIKAFPYLGKYFSPFILLVGRKHNV